MIELTGMLIALAGGIVIGLIYFSALWWTVVRLTDASQPLALYLTSFGIRMAMLMLFLLLILNFGVLQLVAAMLGIAVARLVLVRRARFKTTEVM